jgi:threonine synthase
MPRFLAGEAAQRATTVASAIRISEPVHAREVEEAVRASHGAVVPLADEAILEAWRELALDEGVFCEPSSAAGLAALGQDPLERGVRVVCVVTGHGLKDPETAARLSPPPVSVDPDPDAIAKAGG